MSNRAVSLMCAGRVCRGGMGGMGERGAEGVKGEVAKRSGDRSRQVYMRQICLNWRLSANFTAQQACIAPRCCRHSTGDGASGSFCTSMTTTTTRMVAPPLSPPPPPPPHANPQFLAAAHLWLQHRPAAVPPPPL
jgi:hypothetical protein